MDIEEDGRILNLTGFRELNKAIAAEFLAVIRTAAKSRVQAIDVDLSEVKALDSAGLASLVALRKAVDAKAWIEKPAIRLRQPQAAVQQILELTRLHHLFEIVPASVAGQPGLSGETSVPRGAPAHLSTPPDRRDACPTTAQPA